MRKQKIGCRQKGIGIWRRTEGAGMGEGKNRGGRRNERGAREEAGRNKERARGWTNYQEVRLEENEGGIGG